MNVSTLEQPGTCATPSIALRRVVWSSVLGTTVEWYDFLIYGAAAALLFNKLFFPSFSPAVGTIAAFGSYAVGFVGRPLGGAIFGHFGDAGHDDPHHGSRYVPDRLPPDLWANRDRCTIASHSPADASGDRYWGRVGRGGAHGDRERSERPPRLLRESRPARLPARCDFFDRRVRPSVEIAAGRIPSLGLDRKSTR